MMHLEQLEARWTPSAKTLFALSQDGGGLVSVYSAAGPQGVSGAPGSTDGTAFPLAIPGSLVGAVNPYPGTTGGVRTAIGDVNGDGFEDLVTVPGPGQPVVVKVYDGNALLNGRITLLQSFSALDGITNGAYVAVGQLDASTTSREIIVGAGQGARPRVQVFNSTGGVLQDYLAYADAFRGGVRVASADCNGDGRDDVITAAGPGGGPHVKVFNGTRPGDRLIDEFFAYEASFLGGVYVAGGELDGVPNRGDIATGAGEGGGPHLRVWCAAPGQRYFVKSETFVSDANNTAGVRVGVANLDLRSDRQSVYVGAGNGPNARPFSFVVGTEIRLGSYRIDDFVGGVPVPPGNVLAQSRLTSEHIALLDPFPNGKSGGLFIGV